MFLALFSVLLLLGGLIQGEILDAVGLQPWLPTV